MLTDRLRRKLSKEAVRLAGECADRRVTLLYGTLTNRGTGKLFLGCVMGTLWQRTTGEAFDFQTHDIPGEATLVNINNDAGDNDERCDALVFPLLDLACDLDPSALDEPRAAPSPTPNTRKER